MRDGKYRYKFPTEVHLNLTDNDLLVFNSFCP